jgi:plasmid maintenance system antidote protein VapI
MKLQVKWNVGRIWLDMAERSWNSRDLARVADVHEATISRFLNGHVQTPAVAGKIAAALGYSTRRYLKRDGKAA